MRDYHDLYLKCDVLLLADVFEKFKNNGLKNYGLWLCHYLSAPGLNWDEMLNIAKIKLEPIPDVELFIFFGKDKSGGVSCISNRYSNPTIII